jgi:hypothetical protein
MIYIALERLSEVGLQDGVGWEDVAAFSAGALTVLTLLAFVFRTPLMRFMAFLDWAEKFQKDWDGEVARDGRDHTPGVMERLNAIDGEFKRNGGSTLKDAMVRTEAAVNLVNKRLEVVERNGRSNVKIASANLEAMADAFTNAGMQAPEFTEFTSPPPTVENTEMEGT